MLEIACGTGRVSIPIARRGIPIVGLDRVPGMLARARAKAAGLPARWVAGDARTFALAARFRLIFLTGNAFQAFLTNADQAALLGRVRAHLAPGGIFAFETRNPRWRGSAGDARAAPPGEGLFAYLETRAEEVPGRSYVDADGREVRLARTQVYDPIAQILHWTTYRRRLVGDQEETTVTRIAVRFTFPQELAALLDGHGFAVIRRYGDWDLSPLTGASPSIICVCRPRP